MTFKPPLLSASLAGSGDCSWRRLLLFESGADRLDPARLLDSACPSKLPEYRELGVDPNDAADGWREEGDGAFGWREWDDDAVFGW